MNLRFSLRFKILGLVFSTCIILSALFIVFSLRQNSIAEKERNSAVRKADTIAMDGSLERHQGILEKAGVNLLNTDELISFMAQPDDASARMILEGMFLSFQEEGVVRLTLTSSTGEPLLEEASDRPSRSSVTPDFLRSIYSEASKDFSFHYYFRGSEDTGGTFPVEYCLVTVVTDDDDNILGFAELALRAEKWLTSIAELTGNVASLQEPVSGDLTLTTDTPLESTIKSFGIVEAGPSGFNLSKVSDKWWLTDIIPITDPSNENVAFLLITQDATTSIKQANTYRLISLIVGGATIIFALAVTCYIVCRGVLDPIKQIVDFSQQLSKGHAVESLTIKSRDEVGDMGATLNNMADKIRRRAWEAEAISTGDLTTHISIESADDVLGTSLQKIVDNLGEIIRFVQDDAELLEENSGQIREFSKKIHNSSETINDRTSAISGVSQGIAEDIEKLAAATEEMSASVREISEDTARSKVVSTQAKELSERAGVTISSLNESTKKIEAASAAISEFADQTNLLSLNATIEAARAGDAGKGFAVVASEVKELANQSISTTKSITDDIDEIQSHTTLVVQHTQEVSSSIAELDESALVVSEALTEQSNVSDELASTISGTYEKVRSFNESITDISDSIDSNNEVINSLASSSKELSELANRLKTVVNKFSLS